MEVLFSTILVAAVVAVVAICSLLSLQLLARCCRCCCGNFFGSQLLALGVDRHPLGISVCTEVVVLCLLAACLSN